MESAEMISPPCCPARRRAISDFPTAVGPAMRMGRWEIGDGRSGFAIFNPPGPLSSFCLSAAGEHCREREAGDENGDACQLSRRETVMDLVQWIIAPKIFNDGTENGVANEIGGEHLAVKFFVPEQPRQKKIENKVQKRVVNFRRMHGQPAGRM